MKETRFKNTEIGKFPEDWDIKQLGSLCSIHGRIGFRGYTKKDLVKKHEGAITYSPSDIKDQILFSNDCDYISFAKYEESPEIKVFNGDILFCKTASIGKCAIIEDLNELATINPQFVVLKDFRCFNKYLYYILAHSKFQERVKSITGGSTIPTMSQEKLKEQLVQLPTQNEQYRISSTLTSIDNLISSLDKLIEKKKSIKQGAMQQLLTGKKRLKGFSEPWVEKKLGNLCDLYGRIGFRGYTKNDLVSKHEGAITYSPSDIHNQILDNSNCDYISFAKYEESPEIKVYNGDILFCKTASIGKCAIVKGLIEKATINPQFVVLKNFRCNNNFLYYVLTFTEFQEKIKLITGGSTIPTMSQEKLKDQIIHIPSIKEQTAVASVLISVDSEISAIEVKKTKYESIKQGMMQQLLTGKIRLIS